MLLNGWTINISKNLPQKVATAMAALAETHLGAQYRPVLYLGSQVVNGTNHAVLAEQVVVTGRDTTNAVIVIFNEKPGDIELALVSIERIVEGGIGFGGTTVNITTDISEEAMDVWQKSFEGFVGSDIVPIAHIGSQVINGVAQIYLATVKAVVPNAVERVMLVTINPVMKTVSHTHVLESRQAVSLGYEYAFTW